MPVTAQKPQEITATRVREAAYECFLDERDVGRKPPVRVVGLEDPLWADVRKKKHGHHGCFVIQEVLRLGDKILETKSITCLHCEPNDAWEKMELFAKTGDHVVKTDDPKAHLV